MDDSMPDEKPSSVLIEDSEFDVSAEARSKFDETVRRMLASPAKQQDDMKMGAARKRDARSSGEGSTGKLGGTR